MQPEYFVNCRGNETAFREPEPDESKGSHTVLRGQVRSNPPELPDEIETTDRKKVNHCEMTKIENVIKKVKTKLKSAK